MWCCAISGCHTFYTNSTNLHPLITRSGCIRWFGYDQRRDANNVTRRVMDNVTRRVMDVTVPGTRREGRSKKAWHRVINDDMTGVGVTHEMAIDTNVWRREQYRPIGDREKAIKDRKVGKQLTSSSYKALDGHAKTNMPPLLGLFVIESLVNISLKVK